MASAPAWLRESFRDGVGELSRTDGIETAVGISTPSLCWLVDHDERRRRCSGPLERFHFLGRQRVRNALGALMPWHTIEAVNYRADDDTFDPFEWDPAELILLAEWDPRNAGIACEGHHRRFDSHLTPALVVPFRAVPMHVRDYAADWGLDGELEKKCPPF